MSILDSLSNTSLIDINIFHLSLQDHPELITTDVNLQDILGRAQLSATLRRQLAQQAKQNISLKKSAKIKTEPSSSSISTPTTPPAALVPPVTMSLQPIPQTVKQSPSPIVPPSTPPTMSLLRPIPQPATKLSPKILPPPQLTVPQMAPIKSEPVTFKQHFNEPPLLMLDDSQHHYDPSSDDSDEEMEPPPALLRPSLPTPSTIKVEEIPSPILISPQTPDQKSQRKKQPPSTPTKLLSKPNGGIPVSQHIINTPNRFSPINPIKEEHVTVLHDSPTLTMKMEPIHASSPSIKVQSGSIHMAQYGGTVKAATFSDLEGIDMMHLPVDLDDSGNMDLLNEVDVDDTSSIDIIDNRAPELMQETHVCFFSLVRDIFCSTPNHRTTMSNLQAKVSAWLANPITALNDWYSSADNWFTLLDSGMQFLAGEFLDQPDEFVPYVEYKAQLHIYQWIGAGRDSDQHLNPLCEYWLLRRNEMGTSQVITVTSSESGRSKQNSCSGAEYDEGFITIGGSLSSNSSADRPCSPPPPRCPTSWTVVKASDVDIEEFRVQERRRFDSPHIAFTYRLHGFESVVGPVKGIYTQIPALTKARGHTMLTVDRPNFVTILTLVRDATARLPNGEGTRSDICELLRSSQFINPEAADNVLQTIVSGALDRMHTEHDPCVRYDPKRKIWIYLHRGRSEEEFEKMHQQFQGLSKHKKQSNRKIKHKLMKSPISMGAKPSNSVSPVTSKPLQPVTPKPVQPVIVAAAPQPPAILVPSSSSVVVSNSYVPVPVTVTQSEFQHPVVSVQQTALQLPPPQPQQQKQQPLPALSSIQNPSLVQLSSNQPPLLNKFTNIVTTTATSSPAVVAKKSLIKAELVPIKQPLVPIQKIEHIDVEASLETHTTPILIKQQQKQQLQQLQPQQRMPSLILDTKSIQKSKTNKILMPVVSSQASQPPQPTLTTPIEVSTPAGIQTVHVSVATTTSASTTVGPHLIKTSSLPSMSVTSQQSMLINQNRSQSPMYITSAANKKPTIKPPPLIAQSAGHSYIIPMTIGNNPQLLQQQQQQTHKILTPIAGTQPKLFKAVMPALTSTNAPKAATSLLQHQHTQPKPILRAVPPGKSLISPSVAAANLSLQQQKLISTGSIRPPGPQQHQKISLTTAKGQPTTLTPSQQRQILQNIIAQQQKVRPNTINLVPSTVVVSGSQQIQQPHLQTIQQPHLQTIQPQQQKTVIVAQQPSTIVHQKINQTAAQSNVTTMAQLVSASTITTTSSGTVSSVAPGTSLINRQIIQIHQTNAQPQPTGTTTGKVQTVSAASLTPQQQQNLLQSIKQQQIRVQNQQATATPQQQSLIMKQQQVLQQIQKQLQQQQLQQQQPGALKPGQSLLGINATVVSQVQTNQTSGNPTVARIVKPQLVQQQQLQLQQQHQQPQLIQMSHGTGNNMVTTVTTVRTSGANVITTTSAPMMAKVLTNSTGQIISLENLLQKQGGGNTISGGTTLRVAGAKPGQTSLIQLAGAPGSQIAQYAVVSQGPQGRNLISLATPQRLITTQASTSTVSTTMSQLRKTGASNIVQQQQQNQQQQHQQPKLMQVSQTISGTGQQLVNAKVLGVQAPYRMKAPNTTTGIRMMNASNLNIAHIAGKPVIIASKPVTSANGQPAQVQTQQHQQLQQLPRQNVIWQNATPTGSVTGQQPTNFVIGGQAVKVQGNVLQHFDASQSGQVVSNNTQTVMFGNQMVKLQAAPNQIQHHQQQQHIVVSSASGSVLTGSRTVVLGTSGQTIRVHSPAQNQVVTSGTVTMAQQQQQQMIVGKNIKVMEKTGHKLHAFLNHFPELSECCQR